jgi:hypothetical protein
MWAERTAEDVIVHETGHFIAARLAILLKRRVRIHLDKGSDVTTPDELMTAIVKCGTPVQSWKKMGSLMKTYKNVFFGC